MADLDYIERALEMIAHRAEAASPKAIHGANSAYLRELAGSIVTLCEAVNDLRIEVQTLKDEQHEHVYGEGSRIHSYRGY